MSEQTWIQIIGAHGGGVTPVGGSVVTTAAGTSMVTETTILNRYLNPVEMARVTAVHCPTSMKNSKTLICRNANNICSVWPQQHWCNGKIPCPQANPCRFTWHCRKLCRITLAPPAQQPY